MVTAAAPSISSELQPAAIVAFAARFGCVGVRLLLVVLLLLPVYGSLVADGAWAARLAIVGVLCITLVRPEDGLLLCAAFVPFGGPAGAVLGFPSSIREPFVLAFLAGWIATETIRPHAPRSTAATRALAVPALLFAAVVAASTLTQLLVHQVFEDYPWAYAGELTAQLAGKYVLGEAYPGLASGAVVLEGTALFVAVVVLCHRHARLARRLAAMVAVGGTAIAALNVYRLADIGLRIPNLFTALLANPRSVRITLAFPDLNATGSYLAMTLILAAGLLVTARRRRWGWAVAGAGILVGLWLSGSRSAWASAVISGIGAVVAWTASRAKPGRATIMFACATGCVVFVLLLLMFVRPAVLNAQLSTALASRVGLGQTALRMTASHPIFGVGIGRFLSESAGYIDPIFARTYYARENAHNNFLQILAELGCVGFAVFVWLLAAVGRRIWTAWRAAGDGLLAGAAGAVVAFLLSCLAGHPLLTPEVALAFWLVLGVAAALAGQATAASDDGITAPSNAHDGWRPRHRWLAAGLIALAVSIPIRAHSFIENEADLRRAVIGFSDWHLDDQGVRYRTMTRRGQFYITESTCEVRLAVRVDAGQERRRVDVELRVDDRVANRVRAVTDSWREMRVLLRIDSGRNFRKIELRAPDDSRVSLMTGVPALASCTHNPF
jgi:O-antigen ligase